MFVVTTSSALIFTSCQKDLSNQSDVKSESLSGLKISDNFFKKAPVPGVVENIDNKTVQGKDASTNNAGNPPSNPNNGDVELLLGNQLPNPYTVPNMQQAYNILYGQGYTIVANHKYVRFKPANEEQLGILEDNEDLELQDYPMDYTITQDGDYYQDPTIGTEDIPWLYTVVPVDYTAPAGIQYQVLSMLYIPDNNTTLEGVAESIVDSTNSAAATYTVTIEDGKRVIRRTDIAGGEPTIVAPCTDPDGCGGGGGGGGTPPNSTQGIYVEDQRACTATNTNTEVPVRQVRVVCKRWFKIWRGYTTDLGRFTVSKTFRNNVRVNVKTKNNLAKVSKVRGIRLWQMYFPVKRRLGVFAGNQLATLRFVFTKPANASSTSAELPYWVAATTHNSNIEFRDYSTEFGITQPPGDLKIMITNWGEGFSNTGATPMFNKCHGQIGTYFARHFIMSQSFLVAGDLNTLVASLVNQIDVLIDYQAPFVDYDCRLTSAWLKELAYHELGHASHYAQVGADFWIAYRTAIATELSKRDQVNVHPYGTGNDPATAPILAVGEMWGNHCEYVYANRHYGNGGTAAANFRARLQGTDYLNVAGGLNAYLNAIENFNPNSNTLWPWIPQGLPYDLFDDRNDNVFSPGLPVDDASGYSTQQCFNALQSDIRSIPAFRDRLLQLNGNNQQVQVTDLFFRYGYQ